MNPKLKAKYDEWVRRGDELIEHNIGGNVDEKMVSNCTTGEIITLCTCCNQRKELGTGNCCDGGEYFQCEKGQQVLF